MKALLLSLYAITGRKGRSICKMRTVPEMYGRTMVRIQLHIICSLGSNKHFFRFGKIQLLAELYDYIMTVRLEEIRKNEKEMHDTSGCLVIGKQHLCPNLDMVSGGTMKSGWATR